LTSYGGSRIITPVDGEIMINNTLSERIVERIKDEILSGQIKPGDRLLYETIAAKLKVSLTPVKEALLRLEQEGLVKTIPRKGAFVTQLTDRDITEYTRIRLALECLAVEIACEKGMAEIELNSLRRINQELESAVREGNSNACMTCDIEFHHAIVNLSGNKRLADLINQMPLSNFFALMGSQKIMIDRGDSILVEHARIIETLAARDAQGTISLLKKNILTPQLGILQSASAVDLTSR
jgi:DNA-binding GntR family transcriptional regulator